MQSTLEVFPDWPVSAQNQKGQSQACQRQYDCPSITLVKGLLMPLFKYTPYEAEGPNGTSVGFVCGEDQNCVQIAQIRGEVYVHVPDESKLPEQPAEITLTPVTPNEELKSELKAASRRVQFITEEMQRRIRERYTLEDEQYFSRIGVGAALGVYQFQPGEQEEMLAFGDFVEAVREWGRAERAKIGL